MSLSKESKVATALNSLEASNLSSAAGQQEWLRLVSDFFGSEDVPLPSSDDSDSESDSPVEEDNDDDDENVEQPVTDVGEVNRVMSSCEAVSSERDDELAKIRAFCCNGCKLNDGEPSCHFHNSKMTRCSKKKVQQERHHQRTENYVNGKRVCRETFKFLHCISQNKLTALLKHYKEHGLTPRVKTSGGRQKSDKRLLTHDDICRVVSFIVNFAELHGLVLPGRVPGYKHFDIKLLPSHYTKATVFRA